MTEPRKDRPRKAAGPDRPRYFDESDIDRVMAVVLALASEVSALRDRLDAHERLAEGGVLPGLNAVEGYRFDSTADGEREAWRDAYIRRLFRVFTEDVEALSRYTAAVEGQSSVD